jgi:hypothetical protein
MRVGKEACGNFFFRRLVTCFFFRKRVGKDEEALLLLAADVVPFKRLIHLPIACEEYRPRIPYIFVRHQFHLGATMCVFLFFF